MTRTCARFCLSASLASHDILVHVLYAYSYYTIPLAATETMTPGAPLNTIAQAEFKAPASHAANASKPAPQKEVERDDDCTIFVSNLPFTAEESSIAGLFAKVTCLLCHIYY